ncbi:aspartate/glutamate racemase family protein [Pisciglobus halotolerans]|uniref:Aspartate racemase n=1 Tax=Pisciglobus halotolerans TaxID=745365 RepID=A0A1I3CKH8_9LACT|nr:amino acid racemase [Pisciglobus halotolerans]SFH74958.1 aspartate racemase [Pisciglobus halotolerans]
MKHFFGILGGMGSVATTNFLIELNKRYHPGKDQDYFNYVLFNHAEVPDRTAYILDRSNPDPLPPLLESIEQLSKLEPAFIILPCNTAHYFMPSLKESTSIPIIDMIEETLICLKQQFGEKKTIGLAGTEGTIKSRLYQTPLEEAGYTVTLPPENLQKKINELIYTQVKNEGSVSLPFYYDILRSFIDMGCDAVLLCCTEVSFANSQDDEKIYPVIDTEKVLLEKTIALAKQLKEKNE